jgi:S1-C subfamily serine protease
VRSRIAVPVVCAVLGGAAAAAALLASGVVSTDRRITVTQAAPLLASGPVGGSLAADVYRRDAAGVVGILARTVPVGASAFDVGTRRSDGVVTGSGFVLDHDGRVVTAAHLVRTASDIEVDVNGRTQRARVLGLDEATDLAVLQIDAPGANVLPLELGDSDAVRVGDPAMGLGRTLGLQPSLVSGAVAARQPRVQAPGGAVLVDALQFDTPLHDFDSGGPLLDGDGQVIGVNTRMFTTEGSAVEIAVPSNTLRQVLPRLRGQGLKVVGG